MTMGTVSGGIVRNFCSPAELQQGQLSLGCVPQPLQVGPLLFTPQDKPYYTRGGCFHFSRIPPLVPSAEAGA